MIIAGYGRQCWDTLMGYNPAADTYWKLDYLLRLYQKIMTYRVSILQERYGIIKQTMPGIKEIGIKSPQVSTVKDILLDFAKTFRHYDQITGMLEKKFISRYLIWAKKRDTALMLRRPLQFMQWPKTVSLIFQRIRS
ncbi:MAG: hypothetical protein ACLTJQ_09250 [Dialister invisus]|uniref:hypothetical protein n=1 Tax=Dialister invisus TaxID=218538 RepID=UPI0039965425